MYAIEFARVHKSTEEYEAALDKLLIYVGRYGRQDAAACMHLPTVQVQAWANQIGQFLEDERREAERGR